MLIEGNMSASRTLVAGHSSDFVCRRCLVKVLAWLGNRDD